MNEQISDDCQVDFVAEGHREKAIERRYYNKNVSKSNMLTSGQSVQKARWLIILETSTIFIMLVRTYQNCFCLYKNIAMRSESYSAL